ncbi:MAG: PcfJ domain-containing protein [bacterium]
MAPSAKQFEFIDNSLFLTGPSGGRVRLQWFPVPEAHVQLASGKWHPFEPEFRILAPSNALPSDIPESDKVLLQDKYEAFHAFRAELPVMLAEAVEPFNCYQWPLMRLLKRSIPARDLAKANPVLAYALANNEQFKGSPAPEVTITRAVRYSRLKQREILGTLGFPATEAMVKLFKKVPVDIVHPGLIRKLRQCTTSLKTLKIFAHLPTLTTGVIFLAGQPGGAHLLTSKLLYEVVESPDEQMAAPTGDMLCDILTVAHEMDATNRLRPFRSRRDVETCHTRIEQLHQEYLARKQQEILNRINGIARRIAEEKRKIRPARFPPPPIPGTETIVPLESYAELKRESDTQNNCVGRGRTYAEKVLSGEIYIYRVLAPDRHTLSIVKRGGCWQIGELQMHRNSGCTQATRMVVNHWLNMNQMSL